MGCVGGAIAQRSERFVVRADEKLGNVIGWTDEDDGDATDAGAELPGEFAARCRCELEARFAHPRFALCSCGAGGTDPSVEIDGREKSDARQIFLLPCSVRCNRLS